ncbi:S-layer homology domain-containing protein [Paenibacillus algorifonticola]|uniref:S-layer homology domain-containing protein n=1 Tax=Paenibacillus algorifonticola TaxID=684063 RepID=UPI003D2CE51C
MSIVRRTFICLMVVSSMLGGSIAAAETYGPSNQWSDTLMQWARENGIIEGYSDGSFQPDRLVSEAEFLKILYEAFDNGLLRNAETDGTIKSRVNTLYQFAKEWNHPVVGAAKTELRTAPITQAQAAAIIASANGVHFEGQDNLIYLIGHGMVHGDAASLSTFKAYSPLTRAEAIQWIRQLTVAGMMGIEERPKSLSKRSMLPSLVNAPKPLPLFSTQPLTKGDFDLIGTEPNSTVKFGDTKSSIDARFGESQTVSFGFNQYPSFSVIYNKADLLGVWSISTDSEYTDTSKIFSTSKGIIVGKSTLRDVLLQYGTAGYLRPGKAYLFYEQAEDGSYFSLDPLFNDTPIKNRNKTYGFAFFFEEETLKVDLIMSFWLPAISGDDS